MHVFIANINNWKMTENLLNDLKKQTHLCKIYLVDNGSTEDGTQEFLIRVKKDRNIRVIENKSNVDLNKLWNDFYWSTGDPYLCFLNNDLRIPSNFTEDSIDVFEKEEDVGCVLHSCNHPDYQESTNLNYVVLPNPLTQGWAFTLRRSAYYPLPNDVEFFGGDDLIFTRMWETRWRTAMVLSSPIIHLCAQSRQFYKGDREVNAKAVRRHGGQRFSYRCEYTRMHPSKRMIELFNEKESMNGA